MVKGVKVLVSNHGVWVGGRSYEHASVLLQQLPVCNSGDAKMEISFAFFIEGNWNCFCCSTDEWRLRYFTLRSGQCWQVSTRNSAASNKD